MSHLSTLFCLSLSLVMLSFDRGMAQSGSLKQLRKMGRDSLISRAKLKIIKEYPDFDFDTFSKIRVMTTDELLYVNFSVPYAYVPLHSSATYNLTAYLYGPGLFSSTSKKNKVIDESVGEHFYHPAEEHNSVISFIKNISLESSEVESVEEQVSRWGYEVTIVENEQSYEVIVNSEGFTSGYFVEKDTGQIFDKWHKHKMPSKKEIKEITE